MNPTVPTVINPKTIEKQLKLYEARLQVLQDEVIGLEKLRDACTLLLGTVSPESATAEMGSEAKSVARKGSKGKSDSSDLVQRVQDLLRDQSEGMTLEGIVADLKESGHIVAEGDGEGAVEAALKKNPELFICGEGERWIPASSMESH